MGSKFELEGAERTRIAYLGPHYIFTLPKITYNVRHDAARCNHYVNSSYQYQQVNMKESSVNLLLELL